MDTQTKDSPYSDTFSCQEKWSICSSSKAQKKCIFVQGININFVKYSMFKGQIKARAEEGMSNGISLWHKHAKSNGHFDKKDSKADV